MMATKNSTLVIVESPTKAKTIAKFLDSQYTILSSYGHIRDLPKSKLGIDVEHDFEPQYVIPTKARPVVKQLKEAAKKATSVILATDEDREGEAIAWHLAQALDLGNIKDQNAKIKNIDRIVFHEITKEAILDAIAHPRTIDQHMVDAQQARRVLDRLVGYKLSPFLWKKVAKGLSAGRVQSVTVRLIVEREQEIRKFKADEYWTIVAHLASGTATFDASLISIDGKALEKLGVANGATAKKITDELRAASFAISAIEARTISKNPPAPFTTSTMQQESAKRLHYSAQKTMLLAQRLYEQGLITYMRTDSVNIAAEALRATKIYLTTALGERYAAEAPRTFTTKSRVAQEAHEAIRPTKVDIAPEHMAAPGPQEQKLYDLIWKRFVASQMPKAVFNRVSIDVAAAQYSLRATGTTMMFDGFLKVWPQSFEETTLPVLKQTDALTASGVDSEQHFTEPPARYSEASLIKTLEAFGIGRPSTYAPTISTIQKRNYVIKEAGRFKPTETGELVNGVLTEHFPQIVDVEFTAKMAESLDDVATGSESWQQLIRGFYDPFSKTLAEKYEAVKKSVADEPTNEVCEKCGKPMVIKFGRFGRFMACSGFPDCKNTKQLAKAPPKLIGMKCPDCKEGDVIERRVTRGRARGKIFWGCLKYPACKYASWEDPLNPKKPKDDTAPSATTEPIEPKEDLDAKE